MIANRFFHSRCFHGAAAALLLSTAACGASGGKGATDTSSHPAMGGALGACVQNVTNSTPGLMHTNGMCGNGLAAAGLDEASGLATSDFAAWFNADPALSEAVMQYLYKCAAPPEKSIAWTNPATGRSYTWAGGLGLAPGWTGGGASATAAERQVVSACMGALVNKYTAHVTVLLSGRTAAGASLGVEADELAAFPVQEGCFFGDLFSEAGLFVGADHAAWDGGVSSVRACALGPDACPPMVFVGSCAERCEKDATGTFYERCTFGGVSYAPLTTRLAASDVYSCGDGVCQVSEHCGTGITPDSCQADCGTCP